MLLKTMFLDIISDPIKHFQSIIIAKIKKITHKKRTLELFIVNMD